MADEEQRLIEEARKSREETKELREKSGGDRDSDSPGEPWAKTSSGNKDDVTERE